MAEQKMCRECEIRVHDIEKTLNGDGNGFEGITKKVLRHERYFTLFVGGWSAVVAILSVLHIVMRINRGG